MELIIRDAVPEDSKALAVLNRKEMGYDYPEKQQREKLERLLADGRNRILVAQRAAGIRLSSGETRKGAHAFYRSLVYEGEKMQLNLKKMFQEWSK